MLSNSIADVNGSDLANDTALRLLDDYQRVRQQTLALCRPLQTEDYVVQPIADVSPPKWHLGHTAWFFEQFILCAYANDYIPCNKNYNYIFNSYYESVGERVFRSNRGNISRPTVEEVFAYRKHVDDAMSDFLTHHTPNSKVVDIIALGLQHEQQHQELLLMDIKYILGHNPLFPAYQSFEKASNPSGSTSNANNINIAEGVYDVGYDGEGFRFDNEEGHHKVFLHAFEIQDRLITNGEFLEFMQAGGYTDFRYWLSDGWEWVKTNKVDAPLYWIQQEGQWFEYALRGLHELDLHAPVSHISYFEADAFASWKEMRLPSEFEWEVACGITQAKIPQEANFLETGHFTPTSPAKQNNQMYGDLWEWTSSAYLPYPYFKKEEGALGEYNGKFMVNQMVLRGGSFATSRIHIRPTYRNFFQPHLRWQFSGLRLAKHI